jgi:hypothetical protein
MISNINKVKLMFWRVKHLNCAVSSAKISDRLQGILQFIQYRTINRDIMIGIIESVVRTGQYFGMMTDLCVWAIWEVIEFLSARSIVCQK